MMPRGKKFTAEQIIEKLPEAEVGFAQGKTLPEVVRKLGLTEQTCYRWKREYGGLRTDQAKRRRAVEHVHDTLGCSAAATRAARATTAGMSGARLMRHSKRGGGGWRPAAFVWSARNVCSPVWRGQPAPF
jgi:hypothetical protein